jgi:signal transduction histidine kinase/phage shock protein PspC (stress-responsive transcriptional regulator)
VLGRERFVGEDGDVQTPYVPPSRAAEAPEPPRLRRPVEGRVVGGVCAGLAEHLSQEVWHVRLAFIATTFLGGAGVVAYLFLWALTPQTLAAPAPRAATAGDSTVAVLGGRRISRETLRNLGVGAGLVVLGAALFAQQSGLNLRLGLLVPLLAVAAGAVLAWSQLDGAERDRWLARGGASRREGMVRLGLGVALATVGVVVLATQGRGLAGLWDVGVAAVAVLAGAVLIAAPWAVRLWHTFRDEQAERVRETERADIAAHLHDSVLQTLALIQRKADDPAEVARLARAQERELRGWLYAGPRGSRESLAAAVTEVAHEVEDLHGTPIELVVTGDRPLDERGTALVRALREALLNAVRHAEPPVSAYVEVGPELVEAYVRDHGAGFDVDAVPADRLGVRESVIGRMRRHGGTARLRRLDDGTEVALTLPVTTPTSPGSTPGPSGPTGPAGPAAPDSVPDAADAADAHDAVNGASPTGDAAPAGPPPAVPASSAGDVPVSGPPPTEPQGARP